MKPDDCNQSVKAGFAASTCYASGRNHLDLFSGIGGFALAAKWTGWQTIAFSEIEPYACKILKRHWPAVPNLGDIRNVRGIRADLITGGFPCQPFSLAGQRRGASDDRALWPEMRRVIEDAKPAWVLAENVPGIIGVELDTVLADLERIGYACWPIVIPAVAVDARHRRERVWIVAHAEYSERWPHNDSGGCARQGKDGKGQAASGACQRGEILADAIGERLAEWQEQSAWKELQAAQRGGDVASLWPTEPGMGRVANGIPNRVDRLKGLGNAIVPQVASIILGAMARTHNDKAH